MNERERFRARSPEKAAQDMRGSGWRYYTEAVRCTTRGHSLPCWCLVQCCYPSKTQLIMTTAAAFHRVYYSMFVERFYQTGARGQSQGQGRTIRLLSITMRLLHCNEQPSPFSFNSGTEFCCLPVHTRGFPRTVFVF